MVSSGGNSNLFLMTERKYRGSVSPKINDCFQNEECEWALGYYFTNCPMQSSELFCKIVSVPGGNTLQENFPHGYGRPSGTHRRSSPCLAAFQWPRTLPHAQVWVVILPLSRFQVQKGQAKLPATDSCFWWQLLIHFLERKFTVNIQNHNQLLTHLTHNFHI